MIRRISKPVGMVKSRLFNAAFPLERDMNLNLEPQTFEKYQDTLVDEIVKTVMVKLIEGGLEGAKMRELTASIAFSISSIIDDTAQLQADGEPVRPFLTFRSGDDQLLHCGENSYMHESVYDILKRMFDT